MVATSRLLQALSQALVVHPIRQLPAVLLPVMVLVLVLVAHPIRSRRLAALEKNPIPLVPKALPMRHQPLVGQLEARTNRHQGLTGLLAE